MLFKTNLAEVHWKYLLVAFLASVGLWYTLNAREQIERIVEVRLDYKGLPPGLTVTAGQLNKLTVRLRGPSELLRSMSNRELAYTVDLSGVSKGNNVIPLTSSNNLPDLRAYEVLEVIPSRLVVQVDEIKEVSLPVKVFLRSSPLTPSLRLKDVEVQPALVTAKGPAAAISNLEELTVEIPADLAGEDRMVIDEVPVLAPPAVEISPPVVKVLRQLEVRRRRLSLQRDIIPEEDSPDISVRPSRVNLVVSVPQSLAKDAGYLAQIQVSVPLTESVPQQGEIKAPLQITAPVGTRIIKVNPDFVTLSRVK